MTNEFIITPALYHRPGERPPTWTCACRRPDGRPLLKAKRHTEPWQCIPQADVDAFIARTGCGARVARHMLWLEESFGTRDPH